MDMCAECLINIGPKNIKMATNPVQKKENAQKSHGVKELKKQL